MPLGGDWHFVWAKAGDHVSIKQAARASSFSIIAAPRFGTAAIPSAIRLRGQIARDNNRFVLDDGERSSLLTKCSSKICLNFLAAWQLSITTRSLSSRLLVQPRKNLPRRFGERSSFHRCPPLSKRGDAHQGRRRSRLISVSRQSFDRFVSERTK
jgi:hypothetical protein